jgi:hypothetical protein
MLDKGLDIGTIWFGACKSAPRIDRKAVYVF